MTVTYGVTRPLHVALHTVTCGITSPLHVALQAITCGVTPPLHVALHTVTCGVTDRYMRRYRPLHGALHKMLQMKNRKPLQKSSGVFTPELFA